MKKTILFILLISFIFVVSSCKNTVSQENEKQKPHPDTAQIIKLDHLVPYPKAHSDSIIFSAVCQKVFGQVPFRYARMRTEDLLECMGVSNQANIDSIAKKNLGVILFMGWDGKTLPADSVHYHLYLQPVQFNSSRTLILERLYFNAKGKIVHQNHKGYLGAEHDDPTGELNVADLNNPCPPLCNP
ncbi:hypothetical protein ACFGVR_01535 [Mucilaginibacter sp. AW1-3]